MFKPVGHILWGSALKRQFVFSFITNWPPNLIKINPQHHGATYFTIMGEQSNKLYLTHAF